MKDKYWHFIDRYTGEEFLVRATYSFAAHEKAKEYFDFPVGCGMVEPEVAETMGVDVY